MKSIHDRLLFEQEETRRRMGVIKKLNPKQVESGQMLSAPHWWTFIGNKDNIKLSLLPDVVRRNRIQKRLR
jgi:hypothetical protein